jgi:hypothetical protein
MTISNIENGSPLMWVHAVFLCLFVFWACYLLLVFYEEHIAMQHTVAAGRIGPQHAHGGGYDQTLITEDAENTVGTPGKPQSSSLVRRKKSLSEDSASTFEEMPTLAADTARLTSMSSLKRRGSSFQAWPEQLLADPKAVSTAKARANQAQSDLYELWPVRRGDPPALAASRPPYAGQYTVIIRDEAVRRFEIREKSKFMGVPTRLTRMDTLVETQKGTNIAQNWYWLGGALTKRFTSKRDTVNGAGGSSFSQRASLAVGMVDDDEENYTDATGGGDLESHGIADLLPSTPGAPPTPDAEKKDTPEAATIIAPVEMESAQSGIEKLAMPTMEGAAAPTAMPWENKVLQESQAMRQLGARMRVVAATFQRLFGDDFDSIVPVYPTEAMDAILNKLYQCQAQLVRAEFNLAEAEKKKDELLEKEAAALSAPEDGTASAPASASASAGCFGTTAAAATQKVAKLQAQVDALYAKETELQIKADDVAASIHNGPPAQTFIATFRTSKAAAMALQLNVNPVHWRGINLQPGADPDNINWTALQRNWWSRQIRSAIVLVLIILIMLFPLGAFTGAFSQLESALCGGTEDAKGSLTGTWFCSDDFWARLVRNIITGILPSLLMSIYQSVILPVYIYSCAAAESRNISLTELDRRCADLFFHWNWCNFFLQTLLGGAVLNGLRQALNDPSSIFTLLGDAVPASANFFINYVILRALTMSFFRLFWPHGCVLANILQWLHILPKPKTEQDKALATPLRNCRYSRDIGISTFAIYVAAIGYAVIAPFILPCALIYFVIMLFVWRYQQLYVFQAAYNSHGYIWSFSAHRIVACLAILVLFTSAMFIVKEAFVQGFLCLFCLEIFLIAFDKYLTSRYDQVFKSTPIAILEAAPKVNMDPELFVAPPLRKNAEGWYLEWGKAWQGWGAPKYV